MINKEIHFVILLFAFRGVSCAQVAGKIRADDRVDAYVDGALVAGTSFYLEVEEFSAPDTWQLLAVHANNLVGPRFLIAQIATAQQTLYTNDSSLWACADTAPSGWELPAFDACAWGPPRVVGGSHAGFVSEAASVWSQTSGASDIYCRVRNPDPPTIEVSHILAGKAEKMKFAVKLHPQPTGNQGNSNHGYELMGEHIARSMIHCAVSCLDVAGTCDVSQVYSCSSSANNNHGCCGYIFDQSRKRCLHFRIVPGNGFPNLPHIGPFYPIN